jgi:AraC family transcriptional activator of pobA
MPNSNQDILAEKIKAALTTTEFTIRGNRSYLFVLASGSGTYVTDIGEQTVEAPCMIWIPVGQSARFSISAGTRGFVLRVPETYLGRAIPTGSVAGYVRQTVSHQIVMPGLSAIHQQKFNRLFEEVELELYENASGAQTVVQHCISLILVQIWRASNISIAHPDFLPRQVVHDFLGLVELHMCDHWSVAKYAAYLKVTRDFLNNSVRRVIGTSPHRHIQNRLIDETKTLLLNSDLQVAEIGYKLGFGDAAYFNRFFQRHTAVPPGRFRTQHLEHDTRTISESNFAAWP